MSVKSSFISFRETKSCNLGQICFTLCQTHCEMQVLCTIIFGCGSFFFSFRPTDPNLYISEKKSSSPNFFLFSFSRPTDCSHKARQKSAILKINRLWPKYWLFVAVASCLLENMPFQIMLTIFNNEFVLIVFNVV